MTFRVTLNGELKEYVYEVSEADMAALTTQAAMQGLSTGEYQRAIAEVAHKMRRSGRMNEDILNDLPESFLQQATGRRFKELPRFSWTGIPDSIKKLIREVVRRGPPDFPPDLPDMVGGFEGQPLRNLAEDIRSRLDKTSDKDHIDRLNEALATNADETIREALNDTFKNDSIRERLRVNKPDERIFGLDKKLKRLAEGVKLGLAKLKVLQSGYVGRAVGVVGRLLKGVITGTAAVATGVAYGPRVAGRAIANRLKRSDVEIGTGTDVGDAVNTGEREAKAAQQLERDRKAREAREAREAQAAKNEGTEGTTEGPEGSAEDFEPPV